MDANATQKATTLEQFAMLAQSAKTYTDNEIQQIEQILTYTHAQATASDTWTVNHGLGRYPSVTVVDSAGSKVVGEVQYTSANSLVITFSAPFAGTAYLN